jgi:hypothetical protein
MYYKLQKKKSPGEAAIQPPAEVNALEHKESSKNAAAE